MFEMGLAIFFLMVIGLVMFLPRWLAEQQEEEYKWKEARKRFDFKTQIESMNQDGYKEMHYGNASETPYYREKMKEWDRNHPRPTKK